MPKKKRIPTNLQECFDVLKTYKGIEEFKNMKEEDVMGNYHFNLGVYIRNEWELWNEKYTLHKYFGEMGLWHPDDMSGVILTSFHRYLNGKDLEVDKQIVEYLKYWQSVNKNVANSH